MPQFRVNIRVWEPRNYSFEVEFPSLEDAQVAVLNTINAENSIRAERGDPSRAELLSVGPIEEPVATDIVVHEETSVINAEDVFHKIEEG